jgi:hypothetical protein
MQKDGTMGYSANVAVRVALKTRLLGITRGPAKLTNLTLCAS